jgi:uncharacterized RDD family membrane protein YckC
MENIRDSRLPFGETSAAQNGTVIKTCQQCGAVNGDPSDVCCFCDAPLGGGLDHPSLSHRVTNLTDAKLAAGTEWRREVSSRLHDYRVRRRGLAAAGNVQTALPFDSDADDGYEISNPRRGLAVTAAAAAAPAPAAVPKKANGTRAHHPERFEISIPRLETTAIATHGGWQAVPHADPGEGHASRLAVAPLADRRRAAAADTALLIFSYGGMLALFTVLGGHIGFNKLDLTVAGVTFALFYAQYFALFTVFGGSTPGMMLRRLRVVSFQGTVPTSRQMAWRSFGYLISAGTCFLGFSWALWDDDQLCWHDRISQTYLTPVEELTAHHAETSRAE